MEYYLILAKLANQAEADKLSEIMKLVNNYC